MLLSYGTFQIYTRTIVPQNQVQYVTGVHLEFYFETMWSFLLPNTLPSLTLAQ